MIFFELFTNDPHIVDIAPGQALFREGEDGKFMYVLVSGQAEIVVGKHVVETLRRGGIVGEAALLDSGKRTATIIATSPCQFVEIDKNRFHTLVAQAPTFATQVMGVLAQRWRGANEMISPSPENFRHYGA